MSAALPVQRAVSAGGVVYRRTGDGALEIVLCGRAAENLWVLPKGTPDEGEDIEDTALREVREETGVEARPVHRLKSINYWFASKGVRYHKWVHHWVMEAVGGNVSRHDHEFDRVQWVPLTLAASMLTYANERRVVHEAALFLGEEIR